MERNPEIPLSDKGPATEAETPADLPSRSWRSIGKRVLAMVSANQLPLIAAGIAFYSFLGLFPAFAALVSTYGFIVDPDTVAEHLGEYLGLLPADVRSILETELKRIASSDAAAPTAIIGILIALWGGSKSANAFMGGLNIVFHERETRGFVAKKLTALSLTLGLIFLLLSGLLLLAGIPVALRFFDPVGERADALVLLLRWPVFFAILVFSLGILYRLGPDRKNARWQWIAPGTILTSFMILLATGAFGTFVANFADYGKTYGTLGTVVALLLWLQIVTLLTLVGGALNASLEYQTISDTTTGEPEPIGSRGAFVADNHPESDKPPEKVSGKS